MLHVINEYKHFEENEKKNLEKAESEEVKNKSDRSIYELDIYRSILQKIKGFDFRYPKERNSDVELSTAGDEMSSDSQSVNEKLNKVPTQDPDEQLSQASIRQFESLLNKKCKKCVTIKAPGSHHCSICKCCIARMDHHCPWVNNCVGYYNQKFFLQFLVYVFLGSFHAIILIGR